MQRLINMIKLKNINKYYRQGSQRFHVLHDINVDIEQGELVAIIGESGSGKSTLINIVGFLDDDFEGTYFYQNHPIHDYSRKQFSNLRNQNVGFVFQNFKLLRGSTVADNVGLPLLYAGKRRREIGKRVSEVLEQVGLARYEDQFPKNMSGGQRESNFQIYEIKMSVSFFKISNCYVDQLLQIMLDYPCYMQENDAVKLANVFLKF